MAEEGYDLVSYKDISELRKDLGNIREKKDVSSKDVHDAMRRLADTMDSMLEVFGAAAEQMNLEEKESESESKKHELIISKMDKLLDQNKTIAEGMVAIVDMFKEKFPRREKENQMFTETDSILPKPQEVETLFTRTPQPQWTPEPKPQLPPQMNALPTPPQMAAAPPMPSPNFSPGPDFGMQMPPMEPSPMADLDFPDEPFPLGDEQAQKKKSLFGMFKK